MKAAEEMIFMVIAAIIFCFSVIFLLRNVSSIKKANDILDERASANDIVYRSVEESGESSVSYEELMATLMGDSLEYDIYVDYVEIKAYDFSPLKLGTYVIPKYASYRKEIVFNTDGSVKYIQYWGI